MRVFDIVEYPNPMNDEIIHRFPETGFCMIREGTNLIVRAGQNAILFQDGKTLDLFPPGNHAIDASNIPQLVDRIGVDSFIAQNPFSLEVFFVNMKEFGNEKWGTPHPILVGNAELGFIYIQGWGIFSFRILDPRKFIEKAIGMAGIYRTYEIEDRLKSRLMVFIDESLNEICVENSLKIAAEIIRFKREISVKVFIKAKAYFDSWGLGLDEFSVDGLNISSKSSELLQAAGLPMLPSVARASVVPIDTNFIFVIMSFDKRLDSVYNSFKIAANMVGLSAQRVSDQLGDYRITDRIIENIHRASLIIADLSLERPNVYFELGYARGLGKTIVETALEGTNLHFDIKDWTCIFYSMSDQDTLILLLKQRFEHELAKNKNTP